MSWNTLLVSGLTVVIGYVFVSMGLETEDDLEQLDSNTENNVVVNDFTNKKFFHLSCQTCRKIKNHREIAPRVFECTKCKRRTNLNVG